MGIMRIVDMPAVQHRDKGEPSSWRGIVKAKSLVKQRLTIKLAGKGQPLIIYFAGSQQSVYKYYYLLPGDYVEVSGYKTKSGLRGEVLRLPALSDSDKAKRQLQAGEQYREAMQ